ncbi:MAG TPA: sigma-70 family RNA polymerase sigma factor [Steroidobacteraceae bacterium]|jgi:RNA polymerase sigma-70 factor (ECF subfamily)|nr:sigma-70 family RNA polymerase sigma factor [Steroidobacteraceae bacterium]
MDLQDDDARLMLRYRDGDAAAFAALYAHYKGPLYRYLLRHVRNACAAADLFQEVWSHLIATRARYEPRAKFATFLFHIAHNCAIDFFRRDLNRRRTIPAHDADSSLEAEVPEHQRPDRVAEFVEQQSALLAALAALPHEQREAFLLREETGLSVEEIARITDVPVETAKSRLRYAIRKLKNSLVPAQEPDELRLRTYA